MPHQERLAPGRTGAIVTPAQRREARIGHANAVQRLQRLAGNRAVGTLLAVQRVCDPNGAGAFPNMSTATSDGTTTQIAWSVMKNILDAQRWKEGVGSQASLRVYEIDPGPPELHISCVCPDDNHVSKIHFTARGAGGKPETVYWWHELKDTGAGYAWHFTGRQGHAAANPSVVWHPIVTAGNQAAFDSTTYLQNLLTMIQSKVSQQRLVSQTAGGFRRLAVPKN